MKTNIFIFSIFVLALVACAPAISTPASSSLILVDQVVVRLPGDAMPDMNANGSLAGYLRIKNSSASDDSLVGIQTGFAGMAMFHKSSINSNGVATMEMLDAIKVPAGQTVELKPGELHIMFTNMKQNLKAGDVVTLVLQFEKAGLINVQAQVTSQ